MSFPYLEVSLGLLCQLARLRLRSLGYVCSCCTVNTSWYFQVGARQGLYRRLLSILSAGSAPGVGLHFGGNELSCP